MVAENKKTDTCELSLNELEIIRHEVCNKLPEKYGLTVASCYENPSRIRLQFENFKEGQIRLKIKNICMKSEQIRLVLDKHHIKKGDILDIFILHEGGAIIND